MSELDAFIASLENYDWFVDLDIEKTKVIVYVSHFDLNVIKNIPNVISGKQILFHWAAAQPIKNDKPVSPKELNIIDLKLELDRLKINVTPHILKTIFFEINDRDNCVSYLSELYPLVRKKLELLSNSFGFDIMYEELGITE